MPAVEVHLGSSLPRASRSVGEVPFSPTNLRPAINGIWPGNWGTVPLRQASGFQPSRALLLVIKPKSFRLMKDFLRAFSAMPSSPSTTPMPGRTCEKKIGVNSERSGTLPGPFLHLITGTFWRALGHPSLYAPHMGMGTMPPPDGRRVSSNQKHFAGGEKPSHKVRGDSADSSAQSIRQLYIHIPQSTFPGRSRLV